MKSLWAGAEVLTVHSLLLELVISFKRVVMSTLGVLCMILVHPKPIFRIQENWGLEPSVLELCCYGDHLRLRGIEGHRKSVLIIPWSMFCNQMSATLVI